MGRPSVLKDHRFLAESPTFYCKWNCQQRQPVVRDHIFMANGVVFQEKFYCMLVCFSFWKISLWCPCLQLASNSCHHYCITSPDWFIYNNTPSYTCRCFFSLQGASFGLSDYDGRTPLHIATCEGHFDTVKYLLMHGAPVHFRDRYGHTPLDDAIRFHRHDIIAALMESGAHLRMPACKVGMMMCK